eukprot:tig00021017_g17214.t1
MRSAPSPTAARPPLQGLRQGYPGSIRRAPSPTAARPPLQGLRQGYPGSIRYPHPTRPAPLPALTSRGAREAQQRPEPDSSPAPAPGPSSGAAQGRMAGQEPGAFVLRLSSQAWPDEAAGAVTITYKRHDGQLLNTRVPATLSTSDAVRDFIQSKSDVLQRSIFPQPRASNGEYISI